MTQIIADVSMSLDGIIGGPNGETEWVLHEWFFEPADADRAIVDELQATIGSIVMGRRTYEDGARNDGFVDNPFPVDHFVLTHEAPETTADGETSFTFVTDGVESAAAKASVAAGDDVACVLGGADTIQQFLRAELLDELWLHLVPVLLGDGVRLFDRLDPEPIELERTDLLDSTDVTHLRYRVVNHEA